VSKGRKTEEEKNPTSRFPFEREKNVGMGEGFARSRTSEQIGETKREGGIMVVSLSRNDGQGHEG